MAQISSARKVVLAGKIAMASTRKNRTLSAAWQAASATVRSLTRVAVRLWHEVTGFIFLVLAIIGGGALYREYHTYRANGPNAHSARLDAAALFTLVFLWFGVSSFWRAWKTNK